MKMQVIETDPHTFIEIYPPNYPQLRPIMLNALESIPDRKGNLFALKENGDYIGRVMAFIDPNHQSYGEKVGSFGWIHGGRGRHIKHLLGAVEEYMRSQGIKLIRGPRNDPVIMGGQGVLVHGFYQPELIGVPENGLWLGNALQKIGYDYNTEYLCIRWTTPYIRWTDKKDPEIALVNLEFGEIEERASEIATLYNECMLGMPDVTELDKNTVIEFARFFKSINAGDFLFFAICEDKLVGIAILIPNIYDLWSGNAIQNVNWWVADVSRKYRSRFIFSKMKNAVMDLLDTKGIPTYEGTYIWDQNKQMLDMCLRTGKLVRKHLIFTKELNGGD